MNGYKRAYVSLIQTTKGRDDHEPFERFAACRAETYVAGAEKGFRKAF
jgi:hypothetical protein